MTSRGLGNPKATELNYDLQPDPGLAYDCEVVLPSLTARWASNFENIVVSFQLVARWHSLSEHVMTGVILLL